MERERDILSLNQGWLVHLFTHRSQGCLKDCAGHCARHAYLGVEKANVFPVPVEQVEKKALKFSVQGSGATLVRGHQGMKAQRRVGPL